jgi:hypothetical protein
MRVWSHLLAMAQDKPAVSADSQALTAIDPGPVALKGRT